MLALVLVGVTLGACGDKPDKGGAEASRSTPAVEDGALTRSTFGDVVAAAINRAGSVHIESTGAPGAALEITGDQQQGATSRGDVMAVVLGTGPERMEIRLVGGIVYADLGARTNDKFLRLDPADSHDPLATQLGGIVRQFNTFSQFEAVGSAIVTVERTGDQKSIDGVVTARYDVTFDAAKVAEALGIDRSALPERSSYTYYVGPDHLVRRMVTRSLGPEVTTDFSRWGDPVEVDVPPSSQLVDRRELGASV